MKKQETVAGIDIGGTNTAWGITDLSGKIISKSSFKTKSQAGFAGYSAELASTILKEADRLNVALTGVGIGAPNANYYTGNIEKAANLAWKGNLPLRRAMEEKLGVKVTVTNDANAAALGEMLFGAARGMKNFIMLTLGTGVGSGIVTDGKLIYGHTGYAAELGHLIMVPGGRECGCGREGCLETYASAVGIVRTASQLLAEMRAESSLRKHPPVELNSHMIAEAAEKGDPIAIEAFNFTAEMLAVAISNAVAFTSPEAVILSGGLARAGKLLTEPLAKHMKEYIMPVFNDTFKIIPTALPESDAAILGAAALAISETGKNSDSYIA
jgi:glucokinase